MNLITQFNGFAVWEAYNDLSPTARNLYFTFLQLANGAAWPQTLSLPTKKLIARTPGIKEGDRKTFGNYREELQRVGLIRWQKRSGRQSALYQLVDLSSLREGKPANQPLPQSATQPSPQSPAVSINKKENKKESIGSGGQLFSLEHEDSKKSSRQEAKTLYQYFCSCDPQGGSSYDQKRINVYLEEGYSFSQLHYAITQGAEAKKVNWRYIGGVLQKAGGEKNQFSGAGKGAAGAEHQGDSAAEPLFGQGGILNL